ncbi:MAG: 2-amino-4-hydroxy-6-hydroxymethyldihydropteridine diphosphokinase [Candidatus Omnitrophica bacterium]|nr:2-amino-4-hydroxy-6-hydroxymethyldihydropteridine diphosphokinase [Candidatus Omnitrophota bacterium]
MMICYLGLGSNLGNRKKNIKAAIKKIGALKKTKVDKISKLIRTDPAGGPACQPKFLNAAAKIDTQLSPRDLLKNLQNIEKELGRTRAVRNGPRTIDLDILFYGNAIIHKKNLKIPHPKIFERDFVVKPLLEII